MKMNRRFVIMATLAVMVMAPALRAEETTDELTVITSEKLTFDHQRQFALFENDVVVVDPRMKIYADKMTVRFDDNNKAQNIIAEGNVIIVQDDKRARAAEAEYRVDDGQITLSGEPMVMSGKNIFTAEVMRFWRDENRMVGKPNSRLVIYPEGQDTSQLFGEPVRGR
jgi:lipopolysaccharide transport protein LptA